MFLKFHTLILFILVIYTMFITTVFINWKYDTVWLVFEGNLNSIIFLLGRNLFSVFFIWLGFEHFWYFVIWGSTVRSLKILTIIVFLLLNLLGGSLLYYTSKTFPPKDSFRYVTKGEFYRNWGVVLKWIFITPIAAFAIYFVYLIITR